MLLGAAFPDGLDEVRGQRVVLTAGAKEEELERAFDQFLMRLLNENVLENTFHRNPLSKVIVVQKHRIPQLLLPNLLLRLIAVLNFLEDLLKLVHPANALLEERRN